MYSTMYTDGALTADAITEGIMTFTAVYSVIYFKEVL